MSSPSQAQETCFHQTRRDTTTALPPPQWIEATSKPTCCGGRPGALSAARGASKYEKIGRREKGSKKPGRMGDHKMAKAQLGLVRRRCFGGSASVLRAVGKLRGTGGTTLARLFQCSRGLWVLGVPGIGVLVARLLSTARCHIDGRFRVAVVVLARMPRNRGLQCCVPVMGRLVESN